ncbi:DUF4225 domain-containing protein [Erwinia psidii]|nr:DUF4225 domain-containing protein [Erwinia psidii]
MINGVGVAIYGLQVVVGGSLLAASIASGNVIGIAFSGMLTLHRMNAFQESMENLKSGNDNFVGFLENGYIYTAKLLGLDEKTERLAYSHLYIFVRSSRTHSAVAVSACKSASLSVPASLIRHGGCIKSGDMVGRINGVLAQLHSIRIELTPSAQRIVDIFHHVSVYSPVNNPAFCVCGCGGLFCNMHGRCSTRPFLFSIIIHFVRMRIPASKITDMPITPNGSHKDGDHKQPLF